MESLTSIEQSRIEKLHALAKSGIVCFPERFAQSATIEQVRQSVETLIPTSIADLKEGEHKNQALAGRIMAIRRHGNIMFLDIRGQSGTIQVAIQNSGDLSLLDGRGDQKSGIHIDGEELGAYELIKQYFDIGDFIGINGIAFNNQRNQPTVLAKQIQLLTKSVSPLPEKFHGLSDTETRFRKRYLDMLNPEIHALLLRRSKFFSSMRGFLENSGFMEVDTPRIENTTGGADARPFETHYNAFDTDVFLRISAGELWQKRLMAGGFEKTFEIGPIFRNEGVSPEHAQDYIQMEVYWAYADYHDMMELVKNMYLHIIDSTYQKRNFSINGHEVDFSKEWGVYDYATLLREKTGIDIFATGEEEIIQKLRELGVKHEAGNRPRLIDALWKGIRKTLPGPAFLINEPKFTSPLAKSDIKNPDITHRFHVIIAGSEVGNGYSELNDPIDQLERFEDQQSLRDAGDSEAQMADYEFVEMLKHGMPPTAGFGVSERFFSFLEGKTIRECQTFPYVRRK